MIITCHKKNILIAVKLKIFGCLFYKQLDWLPKKKRLFIKIYDKNLKNLYNSHTKTI